MANIGHNSTRWCEDWQSATVLNSSLADDPTVWHPGFHLPRRQWSLLNRFRRGQDNCDMCQNTSGLTTENEMRDCGRHPDNFAHRWLLTKLDGGLQRLHTADEAAVDWSMFSDTQEAHETNDCTQPTWREKLCYKKTASGHKLNTAFYNCASLLLQPLPDFYYIFIVLLCNLYICTQISCAVTLCQLLIKTKMMMTMRLTYCGSVPHFKPPRPDHWLAPAVRRQKRPVCEPFRRSITHATSQQRWPRSRRRRQEDLDLSAYGRRQRYNSLDVLGVLNFLPSATATVVVQRHLDITVHRNSSAQNTPTAEILQLFR